jgi:site-specific recombinase
MVLFSIEPVTREKGVWLWLSYGLLLGWFDGWFSLLSLFFQKRMV